MSLNNLSLKMFNRIFLSLKVITIIYMYLNHSVNNQYLCQKHQFENYLSIALPKCKIIWRYTVAE